ncbi:MAG: type II toxin-antitoxin system HigB family toxin [Candidatus Sericytochromatia bacterium]|nr:type II toxin-antitoxin system HigB family toxin [Candidatus Sericytochromatia bacterium]
MRVIAKRTLKNFWTQPLYRDSEQPLRAWYSEAKSFKWSKTQDIKDKYINASFLANNRVIFNIHGNKYRLIVAVDYPREAIFIKFIGTHKEYDSINANDVSMN